MIFLISSLLLFIPLISSTDPIVHTEYGSVIGFEHENIADVYLGIPFASPPIKELRFKKPIPPQPWDTPIEAKNFSKACVPHSKDALLDKIPSSEDCLYLNIIAPKRKDDSLSPVLFYIHGGGYEIGNAALYGYKSFADIYASQGIVVVTIQYRLGVLGFLTLGGSSSFKGNYGLFDQVEALKFVHRNIEKFGGDPKRITVFGISAGATSAGQLSLSPLTRDLVAGSIEMSGSPHAGWANDNRVEMHSEELVDACGCWGKRNIEDVEECMRKVKVKDIHNGVAFIFEAAFSVNFLKFAPRIDGEFAPERYEELAKSAPKIPTLTGINSLESAYFTLWNRASSIHRIAIMPGEQPLFNVDKFDMKVRILLNEFLEREETDAAVDDVLSFYIGNDYQSHYGKDTPELVPYLLKQYSEFWSDIFFNLPTRYRADERKKYGSDSYVYFFEHFSNELFTDKDFVKGAFHINEMSYVFDYQAQGTFEWTEEENKVRERTHEMMISFIKNGKPSVEGVHWPSYSQSNNSPYVTIASPQWKSNEGFVNKSYRFWEDVMSKYSFDFVRFKKNSVPQRQIPRPPTVNDHEEL